MTTSKTDLLPKPKLSHPLHFLAFGFGSGCSPKAPGTMGTLIAVGLYLPLSQLCDFQYLMVLGLVIVAGIWICDWSAKNIGVHDHPGIVWDEFAGFFITMYAAPTGWLWIVLGFALFRLFDIWKPWPIRWFDQKVHGGLGIMLDDLIAGVFAWAALQSIYRFVA